MEARARVGYPTLHRLSISWVTTVYVASTPFLKIKKRYHFFDGSAFALFPSRIASLPPGTIISINSSLNSGNGRSNGHAKDMRGKSLRESICFRRGVGKMPHAYSPLCLNKGQPVQRSGSGTCLLGALSVKGKRLGTQFGVFVGWHQKQGDGEWVQTGSRERSNRKERFLWK